MGVRELRPEKVGEKDKVRRCKWDEGYKKEENDDCPHSIF